MRPSPCPPFFRFQIDLLELVKGNIKLNLYLIVPLDTDSLHKLCYNHFLGLKVTVVEQLGPGDVYFPALTLLYQFLGWGHLYLLKLDMDYLFYQIIQL